MKRKKKTEKELVLERFMQEHFDFNSLCKAGFFNKGMRKDYQAQADRICSYFGFKTVFEYGTKEIRCHITYGDSVSGLGSERPLHISEDGKLAEDPFVTVIKPWTE